MKSLFKYFVLLATAICVVSCSGEEEAQLIAAAPYFKINLNGIDNKLQNNPGQYAVFTSPRVATDNIGVSGLIVACSYHQANTNGSTFALVAYDLFCPYEKDPQVKISPITDGKAKCSKCGSEFDLMNNLGTPIKGPATKPLQRYGIYPGGANGVFYVGRLN